MLDDSSTPVSDDLPRPPSGRRSKVRPAGPPPATENTESPAAEQTPGAQDSAAESTANGAKRSTKKPAAKRSSRSTRAGASESTEGEPASDFDAVLSAVSERSKAKRTADPKVSEEDKQQALASLAASIAEDGGQDKPKRSRRRSTRKSAADASTGVLADEKSSSEPEADTTQDNADAKPTHTKPDEAPEAAPAQTDSQPASTDAADEKASDADDKAPSDDNHDGEEEQRSGRRRRRRGGRRRRRSSSHDETSDDAGQDKAETSESATSEDAPDNKEDEDKSDESESGSGRRRRRRRRRSSDDSDGPIKVRQPRSLTEEISGIEGSTRLEAKKQRRREGRAAGRHRAPILPEAEFLARRESVDRVMIVNQRDEYTQIAVLEDGVLVEHYVDRSNSTSLIGNVYLGRVQNVLPSMEAVFIDIGRGRNAVLYAGEVDWNAFDVSSNARKVEQVFSSGQPVLVQVSKDPVGAKGARLTGHISIPGRFVVYSPGGHLQGISRKLPDSERKRLKHILADVVDSSASVIVRTAAEGASEEDLTNDVQRLKDKWEKIQKKAEQGGAPQQLHVEPDLTLRIVRDTFTEDFSKLIVAGKGGRNDAWSKVSRYIKEVAPSLADRMEKWDSAKGDPFMEHRIDEQISKALERKVFLPSGGSLVIDRTEAMTVIDVNTGKFTGSGGNLEETVTKNNLEAAEEIVRQLRLRDIGGIIVVDFIDMVVPSNRELLLRRLVECLGRDRTRHQVSEVTSLGLVQMTRKRIGTGLAEAFTEQCETCGGRGYVRHDHPVASQAPADGGERHSNKRRSSRSKKSTGKAKKNEVHPSDAAREAANKLAAASKSSHGAEESSTQSQPIGTPETSESATAESATSSEN